MSEIFVSYARVDSAFVERLCSVFEEAGLGVWVDIEGLYAGEEFWPEVAKAIDAATVVVFVITPDSVASAFCGQELEHAVAGRKRIVPVHHRDVDAARLHPALARLQWVFFRDGDDAAAARAGVLAAVRADWVRLRQQARLLVRAREWERRDQDPSLLLRGRDLREAEAWLVENREAEDGATPLHVGFIRASRRAATRRLVQLAGFAAAALVAVVVVTLYAMGQRVASLNNLSLDDLARSQPGAAIDRLVRARTLCARFGSLFTGCPDVELNLGRAYLDAARFGDAVAQFTRAMDRARDAEVEDPAAVDFRATAYQNRAFARIMMAELPAASQARSEEYAQAEADLNAAIALYERLPDGAAGKPIAITRARIRIGRGEYADALADLQRAGQVSQAPDVDLLLSVVYHCQGNGTMSLEYFQRYLNRLPDRLQSPHWLLNKDYYARIRQRCSAATERPSV